jgi:hypothetical protein
MSTRDPWARCGEAGAHCHSVGALGNVSAEAMVRTRSWDS